MLRRIGLHWCAFTTFCAQQQREPHSPGVARGAGHGGCHAAASGLFGLRRLACAVHDGDRRPWVPHPPPSKLTAAGFPFLSPVRGTDSPELAGRPIGPPAYISGAIQQPHRLAESSACSSHAQLRPYANHPTYQLGKPHLHFCISPTRHLGVG